MMIYEEDCHSLFFLTFEQAVQASQWVEKHVKGTEKSILQTYEDGRVEYRFYTCEALLEATQQLILQITCPSHALFNYDHLWEGW